MAHKHSQSGYYQRKVERGCQKHMETVGTGKIINPLLTLAHPQVARQNDHRKLADGE